MLYIMQIRLDYPHMNAHLNFYSTKLMNMEQTGAWNTSLCTIFFFTDIYKIDIELNLFPAAFYELVNRQKPVTYILT